MSKQISSGRIVDYDDWKLNPSVFMWLDSCWGPHSIDKFASHYNTQLPRFNSRYWNPGTEAVDAFTANWAGENNWLCPSVVLVVRTIRHLSACAAVGTLLVPCWQSAAFWPILCPDGVHLASFVQDWKELPISPDLILPGVRGSALFYGKVLNSRVLALRINFVVKPRQCKAGFCTSLVGSCDSCKMVWIC